MSRYIYRRWTSSSGNQGYSTADVTYQADACDNLGDTIFYGKTRKSLNAAINDAKKFFKTHQNAYFSIYAHAVLEDFYVNGKPVREPDEDCVRVGALDPSGEYFDLCEQVDWL